MSALELFALMYVFTAGVCLGQILIADKPKTCSELTWFIGVILATTLWPVFIAIGLTMARRARR